MISSTSPLLLKRVTEGIDSLIRSRDFDERARGERDKKRKNQTVLSLWDLILQPHTSIMSSFTTATSILTAGNTAVITGASSGIGRAAAFFCAGKGMTVWMVDVDAEELEAAKELAMAKAVDGAKVS